MTLIAAFSCEGVPIILGDVVVSGPERTGATVGVPTVDELTNVFPAGSSYSITGTCQKVAVLSDDLVVAWAGNVIAAKTLIEELRARLRAGRMTLDSLNAFLKNEAYEITGNLKGALSGLFTSRAELLPLAIMR